MATSDPRAARGASLVLLSSEHASNAVPAGIDLGVPDDVLNSHAAWDPGAGDLARLLLAALPAPLFLGDTTRLVVDLNRAEESPEAVPTVSFGVPVPGNVGLPAAERERRIREIHRPYRLGVLKEAHERVAAHGLCLHLSIHSFSPDLDPARRSFELGILFDPARAAEAAAAEALLEGARAGGLAARANEPYAGVADGLTTWLRAAIPGGGYLGIEVELSQALAAAADVRRVAAVLVPAVARAVAAAAGIFGARP